MADPGAKSAVDVGTVQGLVKDLDEVIQQTQADLGKIQGYAEQLREYYRSDSAQDFDSVKAEWDRAAKKVLQRLTEIHNLLDSNAGGYSALVEENKKAQTAGLTQYSI